MVTRYLKNLSRLRILDGSIEHMTAQMHDKANTNPGEGSLGQLNFVLWRLISVGIVYDTCHPSGAKNFDVVPGFFGNFMGPCARPPRAPDLTSLYFSLRDSVYAEEH
jgi:hypothetical protein